MSTTTTTYHTLTPQTKKGTDAYYCAFGNPLQKTGSGKTLGSSNSEVKLYNKEDMFSPPCEIKYRCCVENELRELMRVLVENISYFLKFRVVEMLPIKASNDYSGYTQNDFHIRPGKLSQTLISSRRLNSLIESISKCGALDKFLEGNFPSCTDVQARHHKVSQLQDLLAKIEKEKYEFATFPEIPMVLSEKYSYKFCCAVIHSTALSNDEKLSLLHQLENIKQSQGEDYEDSESILIIFE
jgi:hypothetical protein